MVDRVALGKFGHVYAQPVEPSERDRGYSGAGAPAAAVLFTLKTRDQPELTLKVNGVEFDYLYVNFYLSERETGPYAQWSNGDYWRTDRKEVTRAAGSALQRALADLALRLLTDPLWRARGAVALAADRYDRAKQGEEKAQEALQAAKDEMVSAYCEWMRADERLKRYEAGGDIE